MNETATQADRQPRQLATLTKYLRKYRGYLIAGLVVTILSNALIMYTPRLTGQIIDALEQGREMSYVGTLVLILVGLTVGSGVFRFLMRRTIIWVSRYIEADLRGEMFSHLLRLSPSYYHNTRTGDTMAAMTNDLEAVRMMVGPGIMYSANALISLVIGVVMMLMISPMLTLWALLPLVVMPFGVHRVGNIIHKRNAKIQDHFGVLTAAAQENIAGARVIKAYGQEDREIEHFRETSEKYIGLNISLAKVQGVFIPLMRLLAAVSYLTVFYVGGMKVINGTETLGTIIAFFGYLALLTWPVIAVGWVVSLYQRGLASLARVNRLLHTEPAVMANGNKPAKESMQGRIECRDLRFSYDGRPILDGVDLIIEPGQTVGLLGLTGSGKTTLVNLIARLHPVDRDMLFIDGVDVNDWPLKDLRRHVGFATQEPFLFSNTIAANIRFGRPDASMDEVKKAAEIAALDKDVAEFPKGYDTMVGERGITLSGGQKQRTAIARAIIVDPKIIILDDATSAVDTETEHEISRRIKDVLTNRTALVISHRVSSVKDADLIVCFEGGRIIERGDHRTLMEQNGFYAQLYRSQLLEKQLEAL